jgi:hypothetical protein
MYKAHHNPLQNRDQQDLFITVDHIQPKVKDVLLFLNIHICTFTFVTIVVCNRKEIFAM